MRIAVLLTLRVSCVQFSAGAAKTNELGVTAKAATSNMRSRGAITIIVRRNTPVGKTATSRAWEVNSSLVLLDSKSVEDQPNPNLKGGVT